MNTSTRRCLAVLLCWSCAAPLVLAQSGAQDQIIRPVKPTGPALLRPYRAPSIPSLYLGNSARLGAMIRGGKLYLTVQDAIALALENNIDVEIARFSPLLDTWNLERAEAGGALPGVPSASSQATSVVRGQGVRGSQAAAGVSTGGNGGGQGNTVNATVTQIGPVTPTLDPVFQDATTFSHLSQPQSNIQQSQVLNLIDNQRNYSVSLQSGFLTGTQANITYTEGYLNENAPTNILNPQYSPTLGLTVTQQLLQGRGVAVNSRTINIDKLNLTIDDLNFKTQVITAVINVLTLYYGLGADYLDVRAKESALDVARKFYQNNKRQVELGALAPLDITTAESQMATSEQDLTTSRATLEQQQASLKTALSRNGNADPLLAAVDIIPLDHIDVPADEDLPSLQEMTAKALANRVDLEALRMHLTVDQLSALGTSNNVLPVLAVQGATSNQGQAGQPQFVPQGPTSPGTTQPPGYVPCPAPNKGQFCETSNNYFVGGIGTALGQMFRRNYPTESGTAFMSAHLRNRQAQADYAIDQLSMRQDQLSTQRSLNQVAVDISNQRVALQQARVRYLASMKNRLLSQQLLDAEQKKFSLGVSTPYNVVTQERDLSVAQSSELTALVAYGNARVQLGQVLGTTLDDVHVSLAEAKSGIVNRPSVLPQTLPAQP